MNILITEPKEYSERAIGIYRSFGTLYFLPGLQGKKKNDIFKKTNILVVRLGHKIDAYWMNKMPNLKIIASPTTGLNHIDTIEAKKRGIVTISLRGHTKFLKDIPSTAEHTMALMLALARNVPWAYRHVADGGWDRDVFKGNQLYKKTLGIIGFGRLGKIVARYAKAFGMNVIAYDPYIPVKSFGKIKKVSLGALCRNSDIISLHASYDPEKPQRILGEKHFEYMKKKNSYFINTARGELIDEKALLGALNKGWIRGAALDVMADEDQEGATHLSKSPLYGHAQASFRDFGDRSKLIIVPHIGGATQEAMQVTEKYIAELVKNYIMKNN